MRSPASQPSPTSAAGRGPGHQTGHRSTSWRRIAGITTVALAATSLPLLATSASPASASTLVRQTATLTQSITGKPSPGTPSYRRIQTATVVVDHPASSRDASIAATVTLQGEPPSSGDYVQVGLGRQAASGCEISTTLTNVSDPWTGTVYDMYAVETPPSGSWDCVVARVGPTHTGSIATDYDVMIGRLSNVYASPKLAIGAVELLGAKQKRLTLVRGVKTPYWVTVRNPSSVPATGVVLKPKGKGIKAPKIAVGTVPAQGESRVQLPIKLTRAKKTKVTLTVSGAGARAVRKLKVRPTAAPARPRPGAYRSKNGVTFRVQKDRIVGWRGRMQTRCGGYPGLPTYTWNTYDFPRTKIPRNGIVEARDRGTGYSATLQVRIAGGKATKGRFTYSGPNRCFATLNFTAKRR